ncbi:Beta-galactosidase [Tritrichomonas foetus]|uniref:Beta-galactosidase n=1 Tax=Tritrichomonas foetus TaxID=1144522 RepID=A0A1J4K793_9EUKA|nr:Beta-galactosidase [Tritrichomonas foetus]|eukprot:OHT07345.1 Beta-galactosidase [Tritrichomonas foetus]
MLFALLASLCFCGTFKIVGNEFQMDGKPFQFVAGAFHYFRQHPDYWEDTIKKMANGGMNVIETYVAWNLHEPVKGHFNWTGMADIERFIQLVAKYNLYLIFRPGPFICAEWDFGGLPYWLLQEPNIEFRRTNEAYMKHVRDYMTVLLTKVKPYLYQNGGPIIMVQVENEYGWYNACDHNHMAQLCDLTEEILGKDVVLFTNDGAYKGNLECGNIIPRAYAAVDFGAGDPMWRFELEREFNGGTGPYYVAEHYTGWLDHWEEAHHKVATKTITTSVDTMLANGGNVNLYMYIGGTNFYFYNGANGDRNSYQADPTSYDYDAPLTEAGDMTEKYYALRDTIAKYLPNIPTYDVQNSTKKNYGQVTFTEGVSLFDALDVVGQRKKTNDTPMTFEALDCDYGYVLYQTTLSKGGKLTIPHVHDRANVFVDHKYYGTIVHAREGKSAFDIPAGKLDILVENQGRFNYGYDFVEFKGITEGVKLDGVDVTGWTMTGFNLTNNQDIKFKSGDLPVKVPSFYRATFQVDEVADTFVNPKGFSKGVAIVNGNIIGRYWTVGPQLTLYCPKPFLHKGENELIIFEAESQNDNVGPMSLDAEPQIDII